MAGPIVATAPYQGLVTNDNSGHNAAVGGYGTAINNHNHDPGDATNGYASSIPAWGPSNALYGGTQKHGPGSAGGDWYSAYANTAAIPADPQELSIAPTGTIGAAYGIAAEIQRLRGAVNVLYGLPATTNWGTTQPPTSVALVHVSPGTADAGGIHTTGIIQTDAQLESNVATGTPPLIVASSTTVPNLSAQYVNGFVAGTTYGSGSAGQLLALNASGRFPQTAIDYDATESATFDALGVGSTELNNLNRLRYAVQQIVQSASGSGAAWYQAPATLVGSITTPGGVATGGQITLEPGPGILLSQPSTGVIEISAAPAGPSNMGVLYSDMYGSANAVVSGLVPVWQATPTVAPTAVSAAGAGTTTPTLYVVYTWVGPGGFETLRSPESSIVIASTGQQAQITLPAFPTGVTAANVYVSTSTGTEGFFQTTSTTGPIIFTPGVSTTTLVTPPTADLYAVLQTGVAYVGGSRSVLTSNVNMALAASSDNYIDWDGTNVTSGIHITAVASGSAAPAVYTNSVRLGYLRTNATVVTSYGDLRAFLVSPSAMVDALVFPGWTGSAETPTTTFNADGTITDVYPVEGVTVVTRFNSDGSITSTYTGAISRTVTTTFSGSVISESIA